MPSTKHFSEAELSCSHCGVNKMNATFLSQLEALRVEFGKPMHISSAYRCEAHNKAEGGAKASMHLLGRAVDVIVPAEDRHEFLELAMKYFNGVGLHKQFTHIDNRDSKIVFFY